MTKRCLVLLLWPQRQFSTVQSILKYPITTCLNQIIVSLLKSNTLHQGSPLHPMFFLIYINNNIDNVHCEIKFFADDTSLFSVVRNNENSEELNGGLERLRLWLWQWKMHFNAEKYRSSDVFYQKEYPFARSLLIGKCRN